MSSLFQRPHVAPIAQRRIWLPALAVLAGFDLDTEDGCVFGDISGALVGLNREAAVDVKIRVLDETAGTLIVQSITLTTDSAGRLARYEHASLVAGTWYDLMMKRVSDGEVLAVRLQAT